MQIFVSSLTLHSTSHCVYNTVSRSKGDRADAAASPLLPHSLLYPLSLFTRTASPSTTSETPKDAFRPLIDVLRGLVGLPAFDETLPTLERPLAARAGSFLITSTPNRLFLSLLLLTTAEHYSLLRFTSIPGRAFTTAFSKPHRRK